MIEASDVGVSGDRLAPSITRDLQSRGTSNALKSRRHFLTSSLPALVAGCASIGDDVTPSSLPLWARIEGPVGRNIAPDPTDTAVIFGTLGYEGSDFTSFNRRVIVRTPGGGRDDEVRASVTRHRNIDFVFTPSEVSYLPSPDARRPSQLQAFVFRVRSGTYEVLLSTGWNLTDPTSDPIATIHVGRGKAAYVGELLSAAVGDTERPEKLKRYFVVRDALTRDTQLARRRFAGLDERDVFNFAPLMISSTNTLLIPPRAD